jgi:hypothetical protein
MLRISIMVAIVLSSTASTSYAQVVTNLTDGTYLAVTSTNNSGGVCAPPYCVSPQQGIPLNHFATSSQVDSISGSLAANSAQINGLAGQINGLSAAAAANSNQINAINSRIENAFAAVGGQVAYLNTQIDRSLELVAVAAAMKDAIPNAGDRFAFRINAAAFSGQAAGAVGFSYNLNDSARVSVNYGQGRSQGVVSGGLNFSFR